MNLFGGQTEDKKSYFQFANKSPNQVRVRILRTNQFSTDFISRLPKYVIIKNQFRKSVSIFVTGGRKFDFEHLSEMYLIFLKKS